MAAETRHAGLTADERSTIRSTVLKARETIENDLYRQLERYGVYDDERVDIDALGHLDAYDKQTRSQIDAALDRELEATDDDYERSVKNYVREATKTYLNRLVALKAIEVRGLVTETMIERPEYGNRSEMHRTVDEVAGELTDQSDNGLGVAVELAFTELTDEIGVIFEESEHTAIDLDFTIREEIIEQLNAIDESVWESDEAMGWVYQYFGEKEREEIDDRIDEENYKVQDTDVATKTQLFTPRYIVEWMVDNSLGRLWLEMYGEETHIDDEDKCFYLSPLEESLIDRDVEDVRDIKVLDPASGSGHMLFYAFDVLYEMYLEQGNVAEKYIPREILANNLYGIDIDPGAAQLAALALYIKAKTAEPDVEIEQINVVSADAVLVNGEKKESVLSRADTELERRVLEQVWTSFEHIREWGSLVRIEERIEEIIEEELEEIHATGQTQFTEDGLAKQSSMVSFSGEEESWEQVNNRLLDQVSELAEEALERNDPIEEMFMDEVEKSVRLLDLFVEEYDVVVSNPPYLGSGKMEAELKKFVKDNYMGSRDLYAAFIERNSELVGDEGYVSMITMETFMYQYGFRKLRPKLLDSVNFVDFAHLENRDQGYMNVCHVSRKFDGDDLSKTRFIRLINKEKENGLLEATNQIRDGKSDDRVYAVDQSSFREINRMPFVYWFGEEILSLFDDLDTVADVGEVMKGLNTGDDDQFLRCWWEIDSEKIGDDYRTIALSDDEDEFYESPEKVVKWDSSTQEEIREHDMSSVRNESYYGKPGITFRKFSNYFTARIHSEGNIFGESAYYINTGEREIDKNLVGQLCSPISRFVLKGLNPGLHYNVSDVEEVPIQDSNNTKNITNLSRKSISIQKKKNSLKETKREFDGHRLQQEFENLLFTKDMCDADIMIALGLIGNYSFQNLGISEKTQKRIYSETPDDLSEYPHVENIGSMSSENKELRSNIPHVELPSQEFKNNVKRIKKQKGESLRKISEEVELSPYTVAMIRNEHDLYTRDDKREAAGRLLSYYLGCAMGRWELEDLDPDDNGIIVVDSDFDDNVMDYIRRCIELTYGEDELYDRENEIEEMLNKSIEDWFCNTFFRYHHCKEYRRRGQRIPIYWHLESDEGAFSCFVYYHKMNADTFPKLRGQYVDVELDTLQNRLDAIESELNAAEGDHARELRSEKEELEVEIEDISEFRDRVDALIDEGFEPDFEAGIWENIQKVDEHDLLAVPLDKL